MLQRLVTVGGFAMVLSIMAFGCSTASRTPPLDAAGVPAQKYLIGGGYAVEFKAPVAGIFYMVDSADHQILATKTLDAGENFRETMPVRGDGVARLEKIIGKPISQIHLSHYFVPLADFGYETQSGVAKTKSPDGTAKPK
ncbi:MAG: hypothetical protein WC058_03115 [Phycisphaeraceae bacterium]